MDATQIVLIVFIGLLLIAYPILVTSRNKKESQKIQEQTNSLKRGDKVLTTSGVYGTIVDLQMEGDKKIVTIETGSTKKKGYIAVDAYAIYTVIKDEEPATQEKTEKATENKPAETVEVKEDVKEEAKAEEVKPAEDKAEQPKEKKKTSKKTK